MYILSLLLLVVRPHFGMVLAVKGGVHPILLELKPTECVANPVYCCAGLQFQVITGLNQVNCKLGARLILTTFKSGKSTYLDQIILLQVLAQIGSYVPADYASFKLVRRIFLVSPCKDDIYNGTSTFLEEMNAISNLCTLLSAETSTDSILFSNSLILIDEFGRGTSVQDSLALNIAFCEKILSLVVSFFMLKIRIKMS
jgi:DNA mismatch repair protein MSH4